MNFRFTIFKYLVFTSRQTKKTVEKGYMDFYNTTRNTRLILKKNTTGKGVVATALLLPPNQIARKKIYMKQPIYNEGRVGF